MILVLLIAKTIYCTYLIFFKVTNNRGQTNKEKIHIIKLTNDRISFYENIFNERSQSFSQNNHLRLFIFEHVRYIMNFDIDEFVRLENLDEIIDASDLLTEQNEGVTPSERDLKYV